MRCDAMAKTRFLSWRFFLLRWGLGVALTIVSGLVGGCPAWASPWVPVTPSGLEQQFIDAESVQTMPGGTVQVRSLYVNQQQQPARRTTYLTEYRCQTREFRDVEYNGEPGDLTWHLVTGDVLNAQTLDYVCAQVGQASAVTESAPKN